MIGQGFDEILEYRAQTAHNVNALCAVMTYFSIRKLH